MGHTSTVIDGKNIGIIFSRFFFKNKKLITDGWENRWAIQTSVGEAKNAGSGEFLVGSGERTAETAVREMSGRNCQPSGPSLASSEGKGCSKSLKNLSLS